MNIFNIPNRVMVLIISFVTANLIFVILVFIPFGEQKSSDIIRIKKGLSSSNITTQLKNEKVIISRKFMLLYLKIIGKENSLNAGNYIIQTPISLYNLTKILYMGKSEPTDIIITIPEGSTLLDIQRILGNIGIKAADDFTSKAYMNKKYSDLWILSDLETGDSLEGYLFPDTYNVLENMSAEKIIRLMLNNLQKQSQKLKLDRNLYGFNSYRELIIFASIVQKESPLNDMGLIAGVFSNRLKISKRLESDATINYFLGSSKLIPNYSDITTQNEYNTYLNSGLPPGAISNPGISALEATINPTEHEYLFFLHTPESDTILSKNFEQHLESRAKYWK